MSEPFPSKAYRELCIENADRLEWQPKFGDWYLYWQAFHTIDGKPMPMPEPKIIGDDSLAEKMNRHVAYYTEKRLGSDYKWLPRLDQLIEMLEEREYALAHLGDQRSEPDFEGRQWNPEEPYLALAQKEPGDYVKAVGPDPATALLRAYLSLRDSEEEVIKEER